MERFFAEAALGLAVPPTECTMPCKPQPHIQLAIFQTLMVSAPAYDSELGLPGTGTRPRRGKLGTTRGTGETVGGALPGTTSGDRKSVV